jgi:uncharacterized protein (UPF0332 family)
MDPKNSDLIIVQIEKGKEKLGAAKALLREGFIDDAISRAYYCMFHAASAVLLAEGITVDSHSALKTMFGLRLIKTEKIDQKYGRWLNRLKDERENGDYDIFTSFDREDTKNSITEAEEFIQEMKRYLIENYGFEFPLNQKLKKDPP